MAKGSKPVPRATPQKVSRERTGKQRAGKAKAGKAKNPAAKDESRMKGPNKDGQNKGENKQADPKGNAAKDMPGQGNQAKNEQIKGPAPKTPPATPPAAPPPPDRAPWFLACLQMVDLCVARSLPSCASALLWPALPGTFHELGATYVRRLERILGEALRCENPGAMFAEKRTPAAEIPPFAVFSDPFADGRAEQLSPQELVAYSFNALEAWAKERDLGRAEADTPLEFTMRVADEAPEMECEILRLGDLYTLAAYAPGQSPAESVVNVQKFWQGLAKLEQEVAAEHAGAPEN